MQSSSRWLCAFLLLSGSALRAADLQYVLPVTDRILQLQFDEGHVDYESYGQWFGDGLGGEYMPLDLALATDADSYVITSPTDPAYTSAQTPINLGRKSRGSDFLDVSATPQFISTHNIYIELPQPLQVGQTYTIQLHADLADNLNSYTFVFDPAKLRSDTVHASHIGYQPAAKKYAYLSHWMGSFSTTTHADGGLNLDSYSGEPFHLVDTETGATVFTGTITLRLRKDEAESEHPSHYGPFKNFSYADVYDCDFSAFQTPGRYILVVDKMGSSYPFEIAADVYRAAYHNAMRGIFHQRAGIEKLVEPGWVLERDQHPDNTDPAKVFYYDPAKNSDFENQGGTNEGNFSKTRPISAGDPNIPDDAGIWGWYHDAGDWDHYVTHGKVPATLLYLYMVKGSNFVDGDNHNRYKLSSSETTWRDEGTNGVPDILDEASWLIKFMRRTRHALMDNSLSGVPYGTGGVPAYVGRDAKYDGAAVPSWGDPRPVLVSAENIGATAVYAALAAWYAYTLGAEHPEYADWVAEAAAARAWLTGKNPSADTRDFMDAATYLLTGDTAFQTSLKTGWILPTEPDWSGRSYKDFAAFIYTLLPDDFPGLDITFRNDMRTALKGRVDSFQVDYGLENRAFRSGSANRAQHSEQTIFSTPKTMWMAAAHQFTGDQKYLDAIRYAADYVLGGNQLNMVLMTGLGDKAENAVFHIDSWYSIDYNSLVYTNPIAPGLAPYGITYPTGDWFSTGSGNSGNGFNFWGDEDWSRSSAFPAIPRWNAAVGMPWPPAEARFQNRRAIPGSEFTVHQNNNEWIFTMGYLTVPGGAPYSNERPTVEINVADEQAIPFANNVVLTAITSSDTRKVAYYYDWHFIGESTDVAGNFAFTWDVTQSDLSVGSSTLLTAVAYDLDGLQSAPSDAGDAVVAIVASASAPGFIGSFGREGTRLDAVGGTPSNWFYSRHLGYLYALGGNWVWSASLQSALYVPPSQVLFSPTGYWALMADNNGSTAAGTPSWIYTRRSLWRGIPELSWIGFLYLDSPVAGTQGWFGFVGDEDGAYLRQRETRIILD